MGPWRVRRSMIQASDHRDAIRALVLRYGLPEDCVLIVRDVREWCGEQGWPGRVSDHAMSFLNHGVPLIVLRDEQTDDMIRRSKESMATFGSFWGEVAALKD